MSYDPNPLDKTEPVSGRRAATAATEFRELKGLVQKTLRMPEDSAVNPTLPTIAQRANKLLSFDDAGNPVAVAPADGDSSEQLRLDLASTAAGKGVDLVAGAAKQSELLKALSFSENADYRVVAGVIRQASNGSGWQFISDSGHTPMGVSSVSANSDFIVINFDFTAEKVISFVAGPDETFAAWGLVCGASVGFSSASLQVAAPLSAFVTYQGAPPVTNVDCADYFAGDISASVVGSEMTVTHPAVTNPSVVAPGFGSIPVLTQNRGVPNSHHLRHGGYDQTSFKVNTNEDLCGTVSWTSGTSFSVSANAGGLISVAWDNTAKVLNVTHPEIDALDGNLLTRFGASATPEIVSATSTSMQVKWVNAAGSYLDTPAATHKFKFRLNAQASSAQFRKTQFTFSRGHAKVNPTKLYSPGGNIWFIGVFKV